AREEDGGHRPSLRGGGAPARGQGEGRRGGRSQGDRPRQLLHGGRPLGGGAVAVRPKRRNQKRLQQQQGRKVREIRGAGGSSRRGGVGAVSRQGDSGLASFAAGLQGRPHPGGDRHPGHGQLQGNPGRALRRSLPQPQHGGVGDRRTGTIRSAHDRGVF